MGEVGHCFACKNIKREIRDPVREEIKRVQDLVHENAVAIPHKLGGEFAGV